MKLTTEAGKTATTCKSNRLIGAHCLCQCRSAPGEEPTDYHGGSSGDVADDDHDDKIQFVGLRSNQKTKFTQLSNLTHRRLPIGDASAPLPTTKPIENHHRHHHDHHQFHATNINKNGFTMLHSSSNRPLRNERTAKHCAHGQIVVGQDLGKFVVGHSTTNKRWPRNFKTATTQNGGKALKQHQQQQRTPPLLLLIAHLMALILLLSQSGLLASCEDLPNAASPQPVNTITVLTNPIGGIETARSIGEPSIKVNDRSSSSSRGGNEELSGRQVTAINEPQVKSAAVAETTTTTDKKAPALKDEASKVAAVETLQAAESQPAQSAGASEQADRYSPPVNPADSSSSSSALAGPTQVISEAQQQASGAAVQQGEDVPVVSAIVNGLEEQQGVNQLQQLQIDSSGANGEQAANQQEQAQQENLNVNVNGSGATSAQAPETSEMVARTRSSENDVLANEQFGRKQAAVTADQQQQVGQQLQIDNSQNQAASKTGKGRSIKRAFAGHMGVFGRKRSQTSQDDQQQQQATSSQVSSNNDQQQQAGGKEEKVPARSGRDYYYYQQSSSGTRSPGGRGKLKSADFPDYREILVQPDQADKVQQEQQQQEFVSNRQEAPEEQQRVEQTSVTVGENDFGVEQQQQPQQQQQVELQQQQLDTPATSEQGASSNGPANGGEPATTAQVSTDAPAQPGYIRLSNIATINSTSGGASGGNSSQSGEMKLMRIYVIDLDQKLVVGNNQPGAPEGADLSESLKSAAADKSRYETSSSSSGSPAPTNSESLPTTPQMAITTYLPAAQTSEPSRPASVAGGGGDEKQQQHAITRSYLANQVAHEQPQSNQGANEQLSGYNHQVLQISPESYVMLDRDSLQANLSRMFAQQQQLNYSKVDSPTSELNTGGGHRYMTLPLEGSEQQYNNRQQSFMYTPLVVYDGGVSNVTGLSGYNSAQLSGAPKPAYLQLEQHPVLEYSNLTSPYLYKNNTVYYPSLTHQQQQQQQQQSGGQIAAVHSQPVQQQRQVYQAVVPQYIAPQYSVASSNPDKEYAGEDKHQQQQQQVQYNGSSNYHHYLHYQQADYNATPIQQPDRPPSNYTSSSSGAGLSAAALPLPVPVQALARQQDKHHANKSSNVYHHHQESVAAVYQQQQQQQPQVDLATYRPAQVLELAQVQQQHPHYYQSELATTAAASAYKVTTAPTSDQRWKPVDHLAPAKILRQQQADHTSSSSSSSSSSLSQPAQYSSFAAENPTSVARPINGYNVNSNSNSNNDHDVVSLAGVGKVHIPAGYQLLAAAQQAAEYPAQPVEFVYASSSSANQSDIRQTLDGQHAPLNYQHRPKQQQQQQHQAQKTRSSAQIYPVNKFSVNTDTNAPAEQQYENAPTVYANENRYQQRPSLAGNANDAPSQQVNAHHHYHPSLSNSQQQYNGNSSGRSTNEQFNTDHLNNNNNNNKAGYAQMELSQQHYGNGQQAAYGNPRQHKQATPASESLPADQSSFHSIALEAPRIPQTGPTGTGGSGGANYRQSAKQQAPASAYMAVNGPAMADGFYESPSSSEELAELDLPVTTASRGQPRQNKKKASSGNRNSGKPARPSSGSGSRDKHAKQVVDANLEHFYHEQQDDEHPPSLHHHHHPPYGMATPNGQRGAPLAAVASYYRPSQVGGGTRALLSWETISSVASGAAKRLPSLSSILAPFAGAGQLAAAAAKGQPYPTANHYQQEPGLARYPYQPLSYTKSAHYDRDVSAFHRPYPLRHMNNLQQQQAAAYSDLADNPSAGGKQPNRHLAQHEPPTEGGEYETGSAADLASSSSKDHSAAAPEGSSSSSGSQAATATAAAAGEPQRAPSSADAELTSGGDDDFSLERPSLQFVSSGTGKAAKQIKTTEQQGGTSYESAAKSPSSPGQAEVISDLAELDFAPDSPAPASGKGRRQKGARKAAASKQRPSFAPSAEEQQAKLEDLEQAAVLSSIEQQLANEEQPAKQPGKSGRGRRPPKKVGPSANVLESLPPPPPPPPKGTGVMFSANGLTEEADSAAALSGSRGPGDHLVPLKAQVHRPVGLSSVQIGQYRITPQTQLVQSIFEPSRQMLGSYFRQYIGQLGQLGR